MEDFLSLAVKAPCFYGEIRSESAWVGGRAGKAVTVKKYILSSALFYFLQQGEEMKALFNT